jgi:3-hydroxybutyryl-CoA dehydrogenase
MELVGVVGGGLIGAGIAEVVARTGLQTVVIEATHESALAAEGRIRGSLERAVARGRLAESALTEILSRIEVTTDLAALADRDLVIEAATEREDLKLELFAKLGALLEKEEAILASNTSSIPIVKLGAVSGRADRVMGVHFFNPAPVMQLVELIPSLTTSAETLATMRAFASDTLGKRPIEATDRAGFVVNSLLVPYILSAIRITRRGTPAPPRSTKGWSSAAATRWAPWRSRT